MLGVLFLTSHLPFPPNSGGRLREYQIIKNLAGRCNIFVCAVTKTYDFDLKESTGLQEYCTEIRLFKAYQDVDKIADQKLPDQMIRNHSDEAKDYIDYLLSNGLVQLIHCEGYYMVQNIPLNCKVPVVLAEQNVEYSILEQKLSVADTEEDKSFYSKEAENIAHFERDVWDHVDLRIALTQDDYSEITKQAGSENTLLISDGIDHLKNYSGDNIPKENCDLESRKYILYVGNFEYSPNADAAKYLIDEIYPQIREKFPDVELFVVGNKGEIQLQEYISRPGVVITGWADDLRCYYQNAQMCLYPLRMGGGIKVKILEALTNNKVVVTTPIGAQGIPVVEKSGLHVGNDVKDIVEISCNMLGQILENPNMRDVDNTANLNGFYSWKETCDQLYEAYEKLV